MSETANHKPIDSPQGGIISALKVQKNNPQRVNVYIDGAYAFGLARITAAWLKVGQALSLEKITQLKDQDTREAAYQRALRLLSYRPRSSAEVRQRLTRLGYDEEVIDCVLGRLLRSGLLDDSRFAKEWADNRSEFRPRSRRALEYELKQHGLDREEIDKALEGLDESSLALQAARKYARRLHGLPLAEFQRKLYGFLARRGFSYEIAKPAVEQVWHECPDQSGEMRDASPHLTDEEEEDL